MQILRPQMETRFSLAVHDPQPVKDVADIWTSTAQLAVIGIFIILLGATLYFVRGFFVPVVAAVVIGTTFSPLVKYAYKYGIPRWLTALLMALALAGIVGLAITLLAGPLSEWVSRAPIITAQIQKKLYILDAPLASLRELQNAIMPQNGNTVKVETGIADFLAAIAAFITPAATQLLIFVITLILYLVGQLEFRNFVVALLPTRDAKLRFLRIINDVEHNLTGYLTVVTLINVSLGVVVTAATWAIGLPNPLVLGLLAAILNYVPYIGPAVMTIILFSVGLVAFPTLGQALVTPLGFVALTTVEGHLITPTIIGRRLTLNPLAVFLMLAFWTWMWGPIGAFLAMPLAIIGLVATTHLFPEEEGKLPD